MSSVLTDQSPAADSDDWSEAEREARLDLAACYRLMNRFGLDDLVSTHLTMRIPDEEDRFLINPFGLLFSEVSASNLVKIDRTGQVVAGAYPVNTTGFVIHGAIHEARPDALCIIHSHAVHCVAVSAMADGLLPLSQFALRFYGQTAVHEYGGGARELDERPRLIADLGDKRVLLMRNHGVLVVGRSVAEAFFYMYYLDQACRIQVAAMSATDRLVLPSVEVSEYTAAQQSSGTVDMTGALVLPGERDWPALRRLLDNESPGYRS